MGEFRMPSLGADMDAGTLVAWKRAVGDTVQRGDVIAEVETDKGTIEVEVFEGGVLDQILVEPGRRVAVGTPLAIIRADGARPDTEGEPKEPEAAPQPGAPSPPSAPATTAPSAGVAPTEPRGPRASPSARKLARERGVDLGSLQGTGPHGAITRDDVARVAPTTEDTAAAPPTTAAGPSPRAPEGAGRAPAPTPAGEGRLRISPAARRRAEALGVDPRTLGGTGPGGAIQLADVERAAREGEREVRARPQPPAAPTPQARMRQIIAAAMARSKREVPHYYLSTTVDMGPATRWLEERNAERPVTDRVLPGVLFLKAVALALREVPELNARWDGDAAPPLDDVHVGVAISLRGGGLVAPATHHTDRADLETLMRNLADLVKRTRGGRMRSSEMADATITVTSLGDRGVESVLPVIYPPQVAIVGFGKVVERPWVVDGRVAPRPVVTATLAADHRVSDGHRGGLFLATVQAHLERPETL